MKIVYIASEIAPFASTGGLGDVGASLPACFRRMDAQVSRIMPFYRSVAEGSVTVKDTGLRLDIPLGFKVYRAEVWIAEEPEPPTYFIRRDEFFDRTHLYGLPDRDYEDNFDRFVFFQKAAVALIDALSLGADIVHCIDWQTGLIPLFLRNGIHGMGRGNREKIVFTIHNLAYQGVFPGSLYSLTNLPFACFSVDTLEFYGNINCMKAGITCSDAVTVPSRTYAQEIQTEIGGFGLHGVLARVEHRLKGILHGVDYSIWDPGTDRHIAQPYSSGNLEGKRACKSDLIQEAKLNLTLEDPLIGMVSRLVDHKGLDILSEALPSLMKMGVGFVLLGIGAEKYHRCCHEWMSQWPQRFYARIGYDVPFSHRIQAGADMLLMPSRFEPVGLNQLYSMRYGTLPIVHATGGLEDTVQDISDPASGVGTGFKFAAYTPDAMLNAIMRALAVFRDARPQWTAAVQRAMTQDFSWDHAAAEYVQLFRSLLS